MTKAQAIQTQDALRRDRLAFAEWWNLVDWRLRAGGAAERLFARAYAAGLAEGAVPVREEWPQPERTLRGRPNLRIIDEVMEAAG